MSFMVLLVEDNDDDVFIMKRALKKLPFQVNIKVAINGRDAIDYLEGKGKYADRVVHPMPSLVLLDLKLPIVHGFEVLARVKQQPALKEIP